MIGHTVSALHEGLRFPIRFPIRVGSKSLHPGASPEPHIKDLSSESLVPSLARSPASKCTSEDSSGPNPRGRNTFAGALPASYVRQVMIPPCLYIRNAVAKRDGAGHPLAGAFRVHSDLTTRGKGPGT